MKKYSDHKGYRYWYEKKRLMGTRVVTRRCEGLRIFQKMFHTNLLKCQENWPEATEMYHVGNNENLTLGCYCRYLDLNIYTERKTGGTADDMSKEKTEVTDELGSVTGSYCQ